MTTQQQAVDWTVQQIGKSLDWDGKWGAQCVDLVAYYYQYLTGKKMPGVVGAKDIIGLNLDGFTRIAAGQPAQPGDIGVWGASTTNQYGHTFIVVGVSGATMDVVDQNYVGYNPDKGAPAARHTLPVNSRLLGFWRPNFVPNPAAGSQPGTYVIKKGDTFWGIEQANGWPSNTLQSLNPALDARKLQIGQQIIVPGGQVQQPTTTHDNPPAPAAPSVRKHTVVNGENLSVIAHNYGLQNWEQIYNVPENRATIGANPNVIQPGQVLIIP